MSEEVHDLEKLSTAWATATSSDLSGLFGIEVSISDPSISQADRDKLLPESDSIVCSQCDIAEDEAGALFFVLPLRGAMAVAAAQSGTAAEEFESFESQAFEEGVAEAYRAALDLCAGILGRVLEEEANRPTVQLGESQAVARNACDDAIPAQSYRRVRFELAIADYPGTQMDLFVGADLADQWFGEMEATDSADSAGSLDLKLAIIDPSPESRSEFEEMMQALGAQVLSVDPSDLGPDAFEELASVAWVVLTWDLGGRSGLEILDRLRSNDATSHLEFAIASATPTRSMVEAALRWGARTVLYQPWDSGEIRDRLTSSN